MHSYAPKLMGFCENNYGRLSNENAMKIFKSAGVRGKGKWEAVGLPFSFGAFANLHHYKCYNKKAYI